MKVFLDTNIILDLLLERDGWKQSAKILSLQEKGALTICVSVLTMVNVAYVYRKTVGEDIAVVNLKYLSSFLEVLPMDAAMMEKAILAGGRDFEDTLQAIVAASARCDVIVTRNVKDFEGIKAQDLTLPTVVNPSGLLSAR
jgi:predicted nucleic acid-binding protein